MEILVRRIRSSGALFCLSHEDKKKPFSFLPYKGPQQDTGGRRARSRLQLVGERPAGALGRRPLGEGRGGGQLLGVRRAILPHRETPSLPQLRAAVLSEVSLTQNWREKPQNLK